MPKVPEVTTGSDVDRSLRQSEAQLRLALEAASMGAWSVNLRTGRVQTNGMYAELLRGPGEAEGFYFADYTEFLEAVHPDDRKMLAGSPERVRKTKGTFEEEFRIYWPDGSLHWLSSKGRVLFDDDETPIQVTGVLVDVTERKAAEEERAALLAAEQEARSRAEGATRRLAQLEQVTEAGLAHLGLDDLLNELLARVRAVTGATTVTVSLLEPDRPGETVRTSSGRASVLEKVVAAVPLVVEGRTIGDLRVGRAGERHFGEDELVLLQLVADRVALAVDRARAYERAYDVAETLQRSLLPDRLPVVNGVALAASYLPGSGATIGGDWYDAIALPDGRLAVVMGDVVGQGVRAASVMGQLRGACRIYAAEGHEPAGVVERLNRLVLGLREGEMATLAYLVLDAATGDASLVSAGHPPPLVRRADGSLEWVESHTGLPLGAMSHGGYRETPVRLELGASLLLYTDGLVEGRQLSLDDGLARLATAVAASPEAPEDCCHHVLDTIFGTEPPGDDVALLAFKLTGAPEDRLDLQIPADPSALSHVRKALRQWLEAAGASEEECYDLTLAVNEAAANVVEHAYGPGDAVYDLTAANNGGVVEIAVRDTGRWRQPRGTNRGRGLLLMEALVHELVVTTTDAGTIVHLRRRLGSPPEHALSALAAGN